MAASARAPGAYTSDMDRDRTARYVLGDLDPPERVAFEQHLRHDRLLRAEVTALRGVLDDVRSLPEIGASASDRPPAARRGGVPARWIAAGAAALACIGSGLALGLAIAHPPAPDHVNPRLVMPVTGGAAGDR